MRFVVFPLATGPVAIIVISITARVLIAARQDDRFDGVCTHADATVVNGGSQPADVMSLMQGMRMQLERLGTQDAQVVDQNDTGSVVGPPTQPAKPKLADSDASMVTMSIVQVTDEMKLASTRSQAKLWDLYVLNSINEQFTGRMSGLTIGLLLALIVFTFLAVWSIMYFDKLPRGCRRGASSPVPHIPTAPHYSRDHLIVPSNGTPTQVGVRLQQQPALQPVHLTARDAQRHSFALPPPMTASSLAPSMAPSSTLALAPSPGKAQLPSLCPTLVMPNCEARFGIPMYQIAEVTKDGHGELTVVGITIDPLLRAVVKKVGNSRTLEISMPERNSLPRATLTTSKQGGNSKTLQIHGTQGFYGTLEMASNGACSVVKNGVTVLYIDGQAEELHLLLKSGAGVKLADVRCSAEPFGGVDHVEIRIEPGIDTVLILAVVLAVLLLSPYLPSSSA
mmetsp:Transcript_99997/g.158282  ORF Transcript_99997/g.158282 Transcript_99997/m.158282 type:complete len:451 (-) Transcript_99997:126-1478(-)